MKNQIRVRAKGPDKVPLFSDGQLIMGRFVGRTLDGSIIEDGVIVVKDSYVIRAINRGELEEIGTVE